jgi:hypothetical protein
MLDHLISEFAGLDLLCAIHEAGEVISDCLRSDRLLERADDKIGSFFSR